MSDPRVRPTATLRSPRRCSQTSGALTVVALDRPGRVHRAGTPRARRATGYTADEARRAAILGPPPPGGARRRARGLRPAAGARVPEPAREPLGRRRGGEPRLIAWSNTAVLGDRRARCAPWSRTGIDVTERTRAEEALRRQAARLEALAEASRVFASGLDYKTTLDTVARRLCRAHRRRRAHPRRLAADGEWLVPVAVYHPSPERAALRRRHARRRRRSARPRGITAQRARHRPDAAGPAAHARVRPQRDEAGVLALPRGRDEPPHRAARAPAAGLRPHHPHARRGRRALHRARTRRCSRTSPTAPRRPSRTRGSTARRRRRWPRATSSSPSPRTSCAPRSPRSGSRSRTCAASRRARRSSGSRRRTSSGCSPRPSGRGSGSRSSSPALLDVSRIHMGRLELELEEVELGAGRRARRSRSVEDEAAQAGSEVTVARRAGAGALGPAARLAGGDEPPLERGEVRRGASRWR